MGLQFAIMTALAERDSTGIELARRFDRVFGYFWSATHQQIYRELDRLRTSGHVTELPQPERPERGQPKRLAITPEGIGALREWLREIDDPVQPREALAVRLRAAAALGDLEAARAVVAHHLEVHENVYATYREIEDRDFSDVKNDTDMLRYLVLKRGLGTQRVKADWCREVLDVLDNMRASRGAT